ncbi:MAG: hypothetical protein P8K10_00325 [Crocinitomicaceae bacterium]|nr:hypothetical protein [Crocinitomicaceae bacterium]
MKKLVFLCITSCGLGLVSCGGTSASDNPDVIVEEITTKDSDVDFQDPESEIIELKAEETIEDDKLKKSKKKV